jgi:hypothetical protein
MNGRGPNRPEFGRRHQYRDLTTDQPVRELSPDRRRSTTMHASVYEALVEQRLREAHSQAREARFARALRAARRAARANRAADQADERVAAMGGRQPALRSLRG